MLSTRREEHGNLASSKTGRVNVPSQNLGAKQGPVNLGVIYNESSQNKSVFPLIKDP